MINKKINFIFWGTPEVASETLQTLKENGYLPALIVTAPDKPRGRKMIITPPPVKVWAIENGIPYIQPADLAEKEIRSVLETLGRSDGDGQRKFSAENFRGEQNAADFFLVVAYGKIMPEDILNMPKFGSINVHYSLLPKYRGASPVESAILNGDTETGVTIQKMAFKLDSGPVLAQERVKILPDERAPELRQRLTKIGAEMLLKVLTTSPFGHSPLAGGEKQDESKATFCKKIQKEDGLIDIGGDPTKNYNKFRAYAGWPRTFFFEGDRRIIITDAELKDGQFVVKKVLPEGKKEISWKEFKRQS